MKQITFIAGIVLAVFTFTACDEKVKQSGEAMTAAAKEKATDAAVAVKNKAKEKAAVKLAHHYQYKGKRHVKN